MSDRPQPEANLINQSGTKRHIAKPERINASMCGDAFKTLDEKAEAYRRWNPADQAERYIDKARNAPVCKLCLRAAGVDR